MVIDISETGELRFVYQDELAELLREGLSRVDRASNVEPVNVEPVQIIANAGTGCRWIAEIFNGPRLGPFETRREAIAAEVEWIETFQLGRSSCVP
jgi:hypothetical protein